MKRGPLTVIWTAICLAANLCSAAPTTFDVAADFSATNNPNGVWSYGWSSTLTSALNLYPDIVNHSNGLDVWTVLSWGCPNVSHNGTGSAIDESGIIWQPGQFSLHPGGGGEYSHARWTAPYAGTFDIAAMFTGTDFWRGPTTDVHVLHNDTSLFDGLINGFGNTSSFSMTVSVGIGDIIDFAVGYGINDNYNDNTALSATISAIPAPGALMLGGIGAGFVGWLRRRRTV
jgi:hypothetical protein